MKFGYRHTVLACYTGYITQAIVNNLAPLLFVMFIDTYGISLGKIGALISINFVTQIITDLVSARYIDRIGYRVSAVAAHILAAAGLVCMAVLPQVLPDPYIGLVIAMILCAIGGGLDEVIISPIIESLPGDAKEQAMAMLHSFYCWGYVAVVLLSTLFFATVGIASWPVLCCLWAIVPALDALLFTRVPLEVLVSEEERVPLGRTLKRRVFWLFILLMIAAGASEQAMSQWASLFAETGLGVSKTMGDLLGPCAFAVLMGTSRLLYGIFGDRLPLKPCIAGSALLCIASYLVTVFAPIPIISLIGCAVCGFSVGIMWPGTFSLASAEFRKGGTAVFALLALAGDVGCSSGPAVVSLVSTSIKDVTDALSQLFHAATLQSLGLKCGLLAAMVFPVLMCIGVLMLRSREEK